MCFRPASVAKKIKCPKCQKPVNIMKGAKQAKCPFCGTDLSGQEGQEEKNK
ncbi:MAG: hypothetical protein WBJ83_01560 [Thermacetogeniaceae bacterium]|jgi:LSD1 subclass zinc finger protein|nr:hypothetical protein [Syntrophomonadaceae bacterium]